MTKLLKACAVLLMSVGLATAGTHNLNLLRQTEVAGVVFKPGDCKLSVENGKAVFTQGKKRVESKVQVETNKQKFPLTSFRLEKVGDKYILRAVSPRGTKESFVLVK